MKLSLAGAALLLFGLSVILLLALTGFESALAGISLAVERLITLLLLVLPAAGGAMLGLMSLARREGRVRLAVTGIILNTLFALFHTMIVVFAG
jgi:hypothetical protein